MLPELDRLIRLQQLDNAVAGVRVALEAFPAKRDALDAGIEARDNLLDTVEQRLAEHKTERQVLEKDAAQVHARLTRFKEQLMQVKTNKEYHAIQAEIATAESDLQRLEDQILERMLAGDELAAEVEAAKQAVAAERVTVAAERAKLEAEQEELQTRIHQHTADRTALVAEIPAPAMTQFETLARGRNGVALGEARDGRCSACRVRLRPQLYNEVRRNAALLQCESCQRILYAAVASGGATESS